MRSLLVALLITFTAPAVAWGKSGARYTYTRGDKASLGRAKAKAMRQARAIEASKRR